MNEEKELWDALVLKLAGSPMVDPERAETTATRIIERRRMFFDKGVGVIESNITDPTKPTRPHVKLAEYWEKGAASDSMTAEYRRALQDCAKELREVFE